MSAIFSAQALEEGNGLVCPFCKSDPERYQHQQRCHPELGWNKIGDLNEHIWRCHAPLTHCPHCEMRWPSVPRKKLPQVREKHIPQCSRYHNGLLRVIGSNEMEIMSEAQQEEFAKVKSTRDSQIKMRCIYQALGKDLPNTYHVRPLAPVFSPPPRTDSNSSTLLDGFSVPEPERAGPTAPLRRSTLNARARAGAGSPAPLKQFDSGYGGSDTQDAQPASAVYEDVEGEDAFPAWPPFNPLLVYSGTVDSEIFLWPADLDEDFPFQ